MKIQDPEQTANALTARPRKRRWKLVLCLVALTVTLLAWSTRWIYQQSHIERRLADSLTGSGEFRYEEYGPRWYRNLADKCRLPVPKQPYRFSSHETTDDDTKYLKKIFLS